MIDLKKRLRSIRDNDWKIPNEMDYYQFALELLDNIGSTDSELRDDLILNVLWMMITNNILSKDQVKSLLTKCMSDKHLFYQIDEKESDGVFNRTFTMLIIRAILIYHIKNNDLLTHNEVINLNKTLIRYVQLEKDLRGYVDNKGFGHAMGHAGDTLRTIALCHELGHDELLEIINVVKEKICIYDFVYINEEAERLVSVIICVLSRKLLTDKELNAWLMSFENENRPDNYPEMHYYSENIKNFLRSLYFRLKYKNTERDLINKIEQILNHLNENYNKVAI